MVGAPTELTERLEISRRQFFQWHLIEQFHISEVKERMDELTKALVDAGYHLDFVADEKDWRGRSRAWNAKRAKTAWKVEQHQKGRDLSIPAEIATLPVWIEWGQDVGDWRNDTSNEQTSQISLMQAEGHQVSHQKISHSYGQPRGIMVTNGHDALTEPRASITSQPSTDTSPNPFNPVEYPYTPSSPLSTEPTPWPRQVSNLVVTTPIPFSYQNEQPSESLQNYDRGANEYDQTHQVVTPASASFPPPLNLTHGNDRQLVSHMNGMELSPMQLESWPSETPTSTLHPYPHQHQSPSQPDYAQ